MRRLGLGQTQHTGRSGQPERRSPRIALRIGALPLAVVLAALVACLSSAPAFATTCNKFAAEPSKGGSDSNTGEEAHPYATLKKLASSLSAGQTGCVFSGQTIDVKNPQTLYKETNGTEAKPITITSTEPNNPATITSWVALEEGSNWIDFTHLNFKWSMPKPWACWNAEGNGFECPGEPQNPEDHVQISVDSHHDSFTYDEIENEDTDICINVAKWEGSTAEHTLIEHDRIYDCGPEYKGTKSVPNEESAWHDHGIYDYGKFTEIKNDYIYGNSRNGIVWYGGGEGGVAEHDVIDGNGNGITFANTKNSRAEWNIITNNSLDDHGKCAEPYSGVKGCDDFAADVGEEESGGILEHNCTYNNLSGELEFAFTEESAKENGDMPGVTFSGNKLGTNPLYKNAAAHEYGLAKGSPCLGYGPNTAQPTPLATTEAASTVKSTEATLNGTVNPESLETKYYFEYGLTKSYGTKTAEASAGSGTSNVKESKTITGLEAGKAYYFRIVATNATGTTDGEGLTFGAPGNTAVPTLSPTTPDQNVPETSTTGTWINSPTSYSYQWERCNASGGECKEISGATSSTYTPVEADVEHTLLVKVTAKNEAGSSSASSAATSKVKPIGQITEYSLPSGSQPIGITEGSGGDLWFTDNGTNKVGKTTMSGTITEYSLPAGSEPGGIVAGPDKNLWFAETKDIGKITTSGTVTEYSLPAGSNPYEIAAGSDSNLWFTDNGTSKIGKITTSGTITEYALPSGSQPVAVAAGPEKDLWFTDDGTSKIGKITTSGTITEYSLPAESGPRGIAEGPDGNLWFTDDGTGKVGKVTASGTITEYALPAGSEPGGITAGADKNLWFADYGTNKIGKITTAGTITEYALPSGSHPYRIAAGPDDNLWFTELGTNKIGKIVP
jgi:streptogramin lyase